MNSIKLIAIVLGYLGLMLLGQVLWKKGVTVLPGAFEGGLLRAVTALGTSAYVIGGVALYGFATFIWLYLLSRFDLSYIYPITSLSFVLGLVVSFMFLGESVSWNRWAGTAVICAGVWIVSLK